MTDYQNELVMEHLDLVNWVIRTRISVPNRPLLTYDDFYAIGCEAICRAALKYQADSGEFAPFACRYIYNAIIDHCRAMNYRLQRSVDAGFEEGEVLFDLLAHTTVDFEAEVTDDSAIAVVLQLTEDHDDDGCEWLVKVEWAIVDDDGYADYRRFFIDDGFAPDLFTEDGLQNILLSKRKRFDAFLRDNQPYAPKCSRIKGNPRDWYICPKTHDWHNNQCRECQNNLINEFRTGTDYRQGGLFFYCAYPRIIHEADKYGEVHLPSIRF